MTQVLLIHSALGLRPAVLDLAERLRASGHAVLAPDLYEGKTFDGSEEGYAAAIAFSTENDAAIEERADAAYEQLSGPRVVMGFSRGASTAQRWVQEGRPEAVGALLIAGGGHWEGFTPATWPAGVPVAFHHAIDDPYGDLPEIAQLVAIVTRAGSDVSDYVYPGRGHLFFDKELTDEYDAANTELLLTRLQGFLTRFP
ncbi:MAG: dienelactone hydrolase family protein [Tetrasphaera sp.]